MERTGKRTISPVEEWFINEKANWRSGHIERMRRYSEWLFS
jgi:hypothetical protein